MAQSNKHNGDFAQLQRHDQYYLNGGDFHCLAGNILFRVHRWFFERESPMFRERLGTPASPGQPRQGTSDSNALVLDVSAEEFEKFLWVFYNPKYSLYDAPVRDWARILDIAFRWKFPEVKDLALRELEKLKFGIIPRIVLYQKYDVDPNLIVPLYAKLCSRDKILTLEESEALGLQTSHLIFQGRERLRTSSGDGDKSPLPPGLEEEEVKNIIGTLMGITAAAPEDSEDKGKGKNTGGATTNGVAGIAGTSQDSADTKKNRGDPPKATGAGTGSGTRTK